MKRMALIKRITRYGCVLLRSGANHDIYINKRTGNRQPVPRHREIDEHLARHIITILTSTVGLLMKREATARDAGRGLEYRTNTRSVS